MTLGNDSGDISPATPNEGSVKLGLSGEFEYVEITSPIAAADESVVSVISTEEISVDITDIDEIKKTKDRSEDIDEITKTKDRSEDIQTVYLGGFLEKTRAKLAIRVLSLLWFVLISVVLFSFIPLFEKIFSSESKDSSSLSSPLFYPNPSPSPSPSPSPGNIENDGITTINLGNGSYIVAIKPAQQKSGGGSKELLTLALTSMLTVTGSVLGFYFGNRKE